jgi:hypothetical protein
VSPSGHHFSALCFGQASSQMPQSSISPYSSTRVAHLRSQFLLSKVRPLNALINPLPPPKKAEMIHSYGQPWRRGLEV